ncbi:hypothetical protein LCGC14_1745000 [marine sediment metagenome]|uniref:Uncharacterized protein n=1 Tax=marine sediment metagenome TaxID=412755 RepID=A0A0F9H5M2_9ZZZZ
MPDITTISLQDLKKDRRESLEDIKVCATALLSGINSYSTGSVIERMEKNVGFVKTIDLELNRRKEAP